MTNQALSFALQRDDYSPLSLSTEGLGAFYFIPPRFPDGFSVNFTDASPT